MLLKQLVLGYVLLMPTAGYYDKCGIDYANFRGLRGAKVRYVEYWQRLLGSGRKKRSNLKLKHVGVVVRLDRSIDGTYEWLIHKSKEFGYYDTIITKSSCMSSNWYAYIKDHIYISRCNLDVDDFLTAGLRHITYHLLEANCQHAANGMWELATRCRASSETKPLNYFLWSLIFFSLIQS